MTAKDSLETFFPTPASVTIAGVEVAIPGLKLRQYPEFVNGTQPYWHHVVVGNYLTMLSEHREAVTRILVLVTGVAPDWLGELGLADMVRLTAAVFEAHIGFFVQSLLPLQTVLAARMQVLSAPLWPAPAGAPPSPDSSAPVTASPNAAG